MDKRVSITDLKAMKGRGEKIVMFTAYDYTGSHLVELAGVPVILVGDTLGMVMLGPSCFKVAPPALNVGRCDNEPGICRVD